MCVTVGVCVCVCVAFLCMYVLWMAENIFALALALTSSLFVVRRKTYHVCIVACRNDNNVLLICTRLFIFGFVFLFMSEF